jgi:hypothetical protein
MKKTLMALGLLLSFSLYSAAQVQVIPDSSGQKPFYLSFSAGPSFPVSSFGKHDLNDTQAGFAKTGYNLNLDFMYRINQAVILDASILYSRFDVYSSPLDQMGISADHWQYYGLLIGPRYNLPFSKRSLLSIKALLGVTDVNSPAFSLGNELVVKESWAAAFAMQFGSDFRYHIGNKLFIIANVDYTYMTPSFELWAADGTSSTKAEQTISVVDLTAGIGINF